VTGWTKFEPIFSYMLHSCGNLLTSVHLKYPPVMSKAAMTRDTARAESRALASSGRSLNEVLSENQEADRPETRQPASSTRQPRGTDTCKSSPQLPLLLLPALPSCKCDSSNAQSGASTRRLLRPPRAAARLLVIPSKAPMLPSNQDKK